MRLEHRGGHAPRSLLGCLLLAAIAAALLAFPAPAQSLTGTIYIAVHYGDVWQMDAAGGTLQEVYQAEDPQPEPSQLLHGGYRWFLEFRRPDPPDPLLFDHREVFAVREDGFAVQLTDDPGLEPTRWTAREGARWVTVSGLQDAAVSYTAKDSSGVDGLYKLDIVWDSSNAPYGAPGTPPTWLAEFPGTYDWSPDGTEIVYGDANVFEGGDIWRQPVFPSGSPTRLTNSGGNKHPRWSPDGTKVLFNRKEAENEIAYVLADVASPCGPLDPGWTTVLESSRKKLVDMPMWSPLGTHLIYQLTAVRPIGVPNSQWTYLCTIEGDGATSLARKQEPNCPLGWRQ